VSGIEEVFLPQMAKLRAHLARDLEVIVDDEIGAGPLRDRISSGGEVLARS
jgi:hypothetical protein